MLGDQNFQIFSHRSAPHLRRAFSTAPIVSPNHVTSIFTAHTHPRSLNVNVNLGIHATWHLSILAPDAPTESTYFSQHTLPMHAQPPHSSALTVRRPSSPLTRSQQASTSIPLLRSWHLCRLGPSTRVGHGRSMSGVVYQRKGARPAASTTPPTAVHGYGSSSHLMYLNSSDANSIGNGYFQVFWPSRWRHVRTPSTGTTTQTKGANDLWASE